METVMSFLLIRFGLVVLGVVVLALLTVAGLAVLRRSLRTPEARSRASSTIRAVSAGTRRGGVVGEAVRRAGGLAADHVDGPRR